MKRLIGLVVCLGLLIGALPVGAVINSDTPSTWAEARVAKAISLGLVPEKLQGYYTEPITREEFASLFVNAVFTYQKNEIDHTIDSFPSQNTTRELYLENVKVTDYSFKDTNSEDIKLAYMMGLVNGTSRNTFSPNNRITREEVATMLVNYNNEVLSPASFDDTKEIISDINKASPWAIDSIALSWAQGTYFEGVKGQNDFYTNKDNHITFDPKDYFTREQAIAVLMNMYKANRSLFRAVMLRGKISYGKSMLKLKWKVSKDLVTCISLKEGQSFGEDTDSIFQQWHYWSETSKVYPNATSEQVVAAYAGGDQRSSPYTQEVIKCGATGVNAVFDMGYAEYEMHNADYIFQFRFKGNGTYSEGYNYYSGSKQLSIPYKRIK